MNQQENTAAFAAGKIVSAAEYLAARDSKLDNGKTLFDKTYRAAMAVPDALISVARKSGKVFMSVLQYGFPLKHAVTMVDIAEDSKLLNLMEKSVGDGTLGKFVSDANGEYYNEKALKAVESYTFKKQASVKLSSLFSGYAQRHSKAIEETIAALPDHRNLLDQGLLKPARF